MQSDRASEQYPTVNLCDDCVRREDAKGPDSAIVTKGGGYDPDLGDSCELCGVTVEEEKGN